MAAAVATPSKRARRVEERAAGETVVHRRRRADHLSMARRRPVGSGPPITETIPALAVTDVAPRARDGEREVADARRARLRV